MNHGHLSQTAAKISSQDDLFSYLDAHGGFSLAHYRQWIGAANAFKEGDETVGVAAQNEAMRTQARQLLARTRIGDLRRHPLFRDELYDLIEASTQPNPTLDGWTMQQLKDFVLSASEAEIKAVTPALSSDVIGCLVKLMSNEELIQASQRVFHPLPGSQIGARGYMSARVQPNSPTDHPDDIRWQVFDAWAYAVGDLVLGTNPVSSEPESVARIEHTLQDLVDTFGLSEVLPHCVLSHIDVQAEVEQLHPGTTGVWFQSLAGTVKANQTFDVTIAKMQAHVEKRTGPFNLYIETGQGADFTNGHGEGVDMVIHEARKYGFVRALKQQVPRAQPWVHVNDVAGFIGPEVFKSKEQLVRCCLEDILMGKLHGLTIGLDICSTLHMDVTLSDLDWCIDQVMPANPAYLMALPTKNDPMLSYLTTSYSDHVRIREKFGYRINDAMWVFYQRLGVIDAEGKPTEHFGDPLWVYAQYRRTKGDTRSLDALYAEGRQQMAEVRGRGVPLSEGYGEQFWEPEPTLQAEIQSLYEDAKESIWAELPETFAQTMPKALTLRSQSVDRVDYVYHPESGECLDAESEAQLQALRTQWGQEAPDLQLVISDGLNARALMDEGHVSPFLAALQDAAKDYGLVLSDTHLLITYGRVRAGYACGEQLFGASDIQTRRHGIIHLIGERPGSGHHNFSVYLTVAPVSAWQQPGRVDHDITRVISGISDTALPPEQAAREAVEMLLRRFGQMG